jgi:paraquat-inducible protein A
MALRHGEPSGTKAAVTDAVPKTRFTAELPLWIRICVPLLLAASAVLNVIALLPGVPFLSIDSFLIASLAGEYSILRVVQLLWQHHLYPLVVLVVGFSILFPPIKLVLATVSMYRPMTVPGRERLLSSLGHLGRWSLLDVYVSLLLLLVLSKETFVGATVEYGLYCFLGAIVLSMIAGIILHEMSRRAGPKETLSTDRVRPLIVWAGWQGVVATIIAGVALVAIGLAFSKPMFQVNKFGLASNIWSLQDGIAFLFTDGLQLFAAVMLLFLVIGPILIMVMLLVSLYVPLPHQWRRRTYLMMRYTAEWSMLDVFSLAMVLYLSEQDNFVPLIIKHGTWYLFGSVVMFSGSILWAELVMRRAILKREAAGTATLGFTSDGTNEE